MSKEKSLIPDSGKKGETVKGLEITIDSLKKSGFAETSKEVQALRNLIEKQKNPVNA